MRSFFQLFSIFRQTFLKKNALHQHNSIQFVIKKERYVSIQLTIKAMKHEPTNVGKIALERQAGVNNPFDNSGIRIPMHNKMHCPIGY